NAYEQPDADQSNDTSRMTSRPFLRWDERIIGGPPALRTTQATRCHLTVWRGEANVRLSAAAWTSTTTIVFPAATGEELSALPDLERSTRPRLADPRAEERPRPATAAAA